MAINYHEKCPAVAQPGRAFGCSSRLIEADHEKQPIGQTIAVTEESQAQIAFGYCQAESRSCPRDTICRAICTCGNVV